MEHGGKLRKRCKMGGSKGLGGISKKIIGMGEKLVKWRKGCKKMEGTEEDVGKLRTKGKRKKEGQWMQGLKMGETD